MGDMYLVRTMSRGARTSPATPAATTAVPSDASGEGLSIMSRPPTLPPVPESKPGSGRLSTAEKRLRVQVSIVLRRTLYRNVTFVPFQTPQEPSRCHSCESTSSKESGRRSSSLYEGPGSCWRGRCLDGEGDADVED